MNWEPLIAAARKAREHAYAPYSGFRVGAALLTGDGAVVSGCNVENRLLGLTNCAERVALGAAIAAGHHHFVALAVVTDSHPPAAPCGQCREVLAEFADDLPVMLTNLEDERTEVRLQTLLPHRFVLPPKPV